MKRSFDINPAAWIAPTGQIYICESHHHPVLAARLGCTEYELECDGWAKVVIGGRATCMRGPTQKQIDALWDLAERSEGDYKSAVLSSLRRFCDEESG